MGMVEEAVLTGRRGWNKWTTWWMELTGGLASNGEGTVARSVCRKVEWGMEW